VVPLLYAPRERKKVLTSIARLTYDSNDRSGNQFPHMKLLLGGKSPPPSPAAPLLPPLLLYLPP